MENNLVIFGPAHAGKSTLGGYMIANLVDDFNFDRFISKIIKSLGAEYDKAQNYAYLLDRSMNERRRTHTETLGTSKYTHFDKITILDKEITIIDTPGAQHKYRERIKGMYFGEVGIFMMEGPNLVKYGLLSKESFETLQDVFAPLFMWLRLLAKKYLIVVISKMDLVDFSVEEFNRAKEMIKTLCGDETIELIPISIDVDGRKDHNVFRRSEKMLWYSGPTLSEKLRTIVEEIPDNCYIENPLFMCIEKSFEKPVGLILRGKIMQGSLKKGSTIIISPVLYKNKMYTTISAKIKNIRRETGADTEIAESGSIVGVNIYNIRKDDRGCEKEDIDIVETSCIIYSAAQIATGNILRFKVSLNGLDCFNILETIMVLWFGKFISSKVIHKIRVGDYGEVILELDNMRAFLPLDKNYNIFFEKFLLKRENKFIPAILQTIGVPQYLTILTDDIHTKEEHIKKYYENFKYEILSNGLKFHCEDSFINLVSKIKTKRFAELTADESDDFFTNISVEIKEK